MFLQYNKNNMIPNSELLKFTFFCFCNTVQMMFTAVTSYLEALVDVTVSV